MAKKSSNAPKLGYVIIYVRDVAQTVAFYERAFSLRQRFVHESGQYAELETGATALAFADESITTTRESFAPNRPDGRAAGAEVALVVSDVHAAFAQAIEGGATKVSEPAEKPWGQTLAYVRDCNGFLVELCTAVRA